MTDFKTDNSGKNPANNIETKKKLCKDAEALQNSTNWRETADKLRQMQQEWKLTGYVEPKEVGDELYARFRKACDIFFDNRTKAYQNQELERIDNLYRKIELCEKVEALDKIEDVEMAIEEVQKIFEEWKEIGPVPREKSDALWERFKNGQDAVYRKRRALFEEKETERLENLKLKEELCKEVEALAERDDFNEVTPLIINIQERWKEIGQVPKEKSEEIWQRFRKSCDAFFDRKTEYNNRLDEQRLENLIIRQNICKEAEELKDSVEWNETSEKLKKLQADWKIAWPVPKDEGDKLWETFRSACDYFFERKKTYYEEKHIEWQKQQAVWRMNMEKVVARKTDEIDRLEASLEYEKNHIYEWKLRMDRLPIELKSVDAKMEIEEKIAKSNSEIERKTAMIRQLELDIADIKNKLEN